MVLGKKSPRGMRLSASTKVTVPAETRLPWESWREGQCSSLGEEPLLTKPRENWHRKGRFQACICFSSNEVPTWDSYSPYQGTWV